MLIVTPRYSLRCLANSVTYLLYYSLLSALACYRNIEDRYAAIKILVPAHNNIPATMGEFVRNVVSEAVQSCGRESKSGRDAHAMAEMIRYLGPESFREL